MPESNYKVGKRTYILWKRWVPNPVGLEHKTWRVTGIEGENAGKGQFLKGFKCHAEKFKFYLNKRIEGH